MKSKNLLFAALVLAPCIVFAEGGNVVYNALPSWIWLALLGIVEIALRLIPSSRPYFTILGAAKYILDLIIPDNTNEVETKLNKKSDYTISTKTQDSIKPRRKVWAMFKK